MFGIIQLHKYCYYNFINFKLYNFGRNKTYNGFSFIEILKDIKTYHYIDNQQIEADCFGFLSDGYRLIYLNETDIRDSEIVSYLSNKSLCSNFDFYFMWKYNKSNVLFSLNEYLTGPGTYGLSFETINENNQMSFDCFYLWDPKYVNQEKGIILYDYWEEFVDSEDEEKLCELSVPNFTAAMTTAKIYCAPCAYNSVFTWDEVTQEMELSINNMCFEIIPEVGEVKHPLVKWRDIYLRNDRNYQKLKNNYYPEQS